MDITEFKKHMENRGGPAFPMTIEPSNDNKDREIFPGMTLRDYFAGQAMLNSALCTGQMPERDLETHFPGAINILVADIAAVQAYIAADAMLRVRNK